MRQNEKMCQTTSFGSGRLARRRREARRVPRSDGAVEDEGPAPLDDAAAAGGVPRTIAFFAANSAAVSTPSS